MLACEHLVGHSSDPSIFKKPQLVPVQDLKLLVRDYPVSGQSSLIECIELTTYILTSS